MACGTAYPFLATLRSSEGGRWTLPEGQSPEERVNRWLSRPNFFPFADSHCHLDRLRRQLPIPEPAGLEVFASEREYWPREMITNYVFPDDFGAFEELEVGDLNWCE